MKGGSCLKGWFPPFIQNFYSFLISFKTFKKKKETRKDVTFSKFTFSHFFLLKKKEGIFLKWRKGHSKNQEKRVFQIFSLFFPEKWTKKEKRKECQKKKFFSFDIFWSLWNKFKKDFYEKLYNLFINCSSCCTCLVYNYSSFINWNQSFFPWSFSFFILRNYFFNFLGFFFQKTPKIFWNSLHR